MTPTSVIRCETAQLGFFSFLVSFIAARVLVFLIMARKLPDFSLHLGGTHVHHLNYGIFLLSVVGAYLLFQRPEGRKLRVAAVIYAFGLALTFDEFGMWLHLGGSYWQRASFDAVTVVAALLALIAFIPSWKTVREAHWRTLALSFAVSGCFFLMWSRSFEYAEHTLSPKLHRIEADGPR